MSIELVKAEIAKFLIDPQPAVLCLRGKWGVGKTYAWNEQLEVVQAAKRLAMRSYSYVSLFGLNSLDALKFAVFEHSQKVDDGIRVASLETLEEYVGMLPRWKAFLKPATSGSLVSRLIGGDAVEALSFMLVRSQIVCFDDFERRSEGLKTKDVLGLVSFLREQRNCKVVLILNDEHLDEEGRAEFETHLEKVVDVSLVYEPTPTQSAAIGAGSQWDDARRHVAERCAALGITNIRTIKRVVRLVDTIKPKLADYDPEVLRAAIASLALFCWCRDNPADAPTLDFIASKTQYSFGLHARDNAEGEEDAGDDASRWNAALHAYGYMWPDEFDLVLMEAVRKGYFDNEKLAAEARKQSAKFEKGRLEGSFEAAWRKVDASFADDQDAVLEGIRGALLRNIEHVTPTNLSATVTLFKKLGQTEQAAAIIARYVEARRGEPRLFDLAQSHFGQYVDDPDVKGAFEKAAAEPRERPDFITLLAGAKEDWSTERLEALAAAPVEDYCRAFKSTSGEGHRRLLANALHFRDIGGATEPMRIVTEKATEALLSIAEETPFNALRVARLGVVAKSTRPQSSDSAIPT